MYKYTVGIDLSGARNTDHQLIIDLTEHISNFINMSSQEESQNLAVIAQYFTEFWGKGNADVVDTLCADDFVMNYPMHGVRVGRQAVKEMLLEFKEVCGPPHVKSARTTIKMCF